MIDSAVSRLCKAALAAVTVIAMGTGCTTGGTAAVEDTLKALATQGSAAAPTDGQFTYLRTTSDGRSLHLVLGYQNQTPQGPLQDWYSRSGEVVKLLDGRLQGTAGLSTDWRHSNADQAPRWDAVLQALAQPGAQPSWQRVRDVMPGYRFGVAERLSLHLAQPPVALNFDGPLPEQLVWVEERSDAGLPPSLFAVRRNAAPGQDRVVWSRQCLATDLCLEFQPWAPKLSQP